ncbi:MAG: peptide ABC transporter substrate-binding protein [Thermomicrobiales bacterium]
MGVGGVLVGSLLAACGGDDDDDDDSSSAPTATSAPESNEATATTPSEGEGEASPTEGSSDAPAGMTPVGTLADEQVLRLPGTEPNDLDPAVSYGYGLPQFRNLFDGLVGIDPRSNEVVPQLAESFEANDDATVYTFTLRSGLTWSDGTPLAAEDFVWSWKRVLDPETRSQYIPALYPIKGAQEAADDPGLVDDLGVAAPDDQTVEVTLVGPTPYFPLLVTTWTFYPVPKHVVDEKGAEWYEAGNMVSTGPYVLSEWNHNQSIILERNPEYWDEQPTLARMEYSLFDDELAQGIIAYENDELDETEVPGSDLQRVRDDSSLSEQIIQLERSSTRFVVCDTTNAPTDDYRVRQALSMSIDRETLTQQIRLGDSEPAYTVLPPDIAGYNPDASLGMDVDKAVSLLADAGYDDPSEIEISLVYISTATYKLDAEYLQNAWSENLGINVTLEPIEQNTYSDWRASRETSPFNVYIGNWGSDFGDPYNWHNQNFTTESDHYRNHWEYPDFNDLVAEAAVNTDEEERRKQYEDAEAMLVEQAPIIPLWHQLSFFLVKPYVKNVFLQPILPVVYGKYVSIEEH